MNSVSQRKILHVDMDCFYAAVEMRDDPGLRGRPVAVGGTAEGRGVICAASYEARTWGVKSAMPAGRAQSLCPDLVLLPPDFRKYKEASRHIHKIFSEYSDLVEPLSLDEAFLDVTDSDHHKGSATLIAREIRTRIQSELHRTASAGVAPNKFLAKVASDLDKPDGLVVITPPEVKSFVRDLPVGRIFGVGPVTAARMKDLGIHTCGDLQGYPRTEIIQRFGRHGESLYHLCRGDDSRPVRTDRLRKSLSVEETFAQDRTGQEACLDEVPPLLDELQRRLKRARNKQPSRIHTVFLKMRFKDFTTTTIQAAGDAPSLSTYKRLCRKAWQRGNRPVRLLGLGVRFQEPQQNQSSRQLMLPLNA